MSASPPDCAAHGKRGRKRFIAYGLLSMALAGVLVVCGPMPNTARAENITESYDPSTCATDAMGMVYVRLNNGLGYRFPADEPVFVASPELRYPYAFSPADDPSEPLGCPSNPYKSVSVGFSVPFDAVPIEEQRLPPRYRNAPIAASIRAEREGFTKLELDFTEESFQRMCDARPGLVFTGPHGFWACRRPDENRAPEDQSTLYIAPPGGHTKISGAQFGVNCTERLFGPGRRCGVGHFLIARPDLGYAPGELGRLSYGFDDRRVPIEYVIELDQAVRAKAAAVRYPPIDGPEPRPYVSRTAE